MIDGVGGSTAEQELAAMVPQKSYVPIAVEERQLRIEQAQRL
ncbi:MAG: aminopeptidase P family protein, partial [Proteobacteria bacterium]|nr:aminopeptidase P family protein [Pseudomonadota bacterium]